MRDVHWMAVCAQGSEVWRPCRVCFLHESPGLAAQWGRSQHSPGTHCLIQRYKQVWDPSPSPFIPLFKWSLWKHLLAHLGPWWVGRKARDHLYNCGSVIFYFYGNELNSYINPGCGKQGSSLLEIFCSTNLPLCYLVEKAYSGGNAYLLCLKHSAEEIYFRYAFLHISWHATCFATALLCFVGRSAGSGTGHYLLFEQGWGSSCASLNTVPAILPISYVGHTPGGGKTLRCFTGYGEGLKEPG